MAVRRIVAVITAGGALLGGLLAGDESGGTPAPALPEGAVVAVGDAPPIVGPDVEDLVAMASSPTGAGWWATSSEGVVRTAGDAIDAGGVASSTRLNRPIVGMAAPPTGGGYWLVASD